MEELEQLKRILAILDRTINELGSIAKELKTGKASEDAYKVKISDKAKNGH